MIHQATVVGHDWGGAIAWDLAVHFPERIRSIKTNYFVCLIVVNVCVLLFELLFSWSISQLVVFFPASVLRGRGYY